MGARAQIKIIESEETAPVYLYTHWGSGELKETLKKALAKKWRWNDYEYLTRIIFDEMIGKDQGMETGFGISTTEHGDNDYLIEILPNQKVKIGSQEWIFEEYIK